MNRQRWSWVVVGVLIGATVALFFACFERRTESEYRGASLEAQRNPYLAWQLLLERMGHEVTILDGPIDLEGALPSTDATIFYPATRTTLGEQRSERLLRWVKTGGHLWVVTWTLWDDEDRRPDYLLDPLGIRQFMPEEPDEDAEDESETSSDSPAEPDEDVLAPGVMGNTWPDVQWDVASVAFRDEERPLEVFFDRGFWLETPDVDLLSEVSGETGTHLVQITHGFGVVTVMTDDYLMRNDGLGSADHAEFALRLLRRDAGPQAVWLLPFENWPGLWKLVRARGWALLVAGGFWLLAWVWRAGRRFGPLISEPPPIRRSLLEHVEAAGHLLARGRRDVLIESVRDALGDELRTRRPGWLRIPHAELEERLAGSADLDVAAVSSALHGEDVASTRAAFTHTIATLERIRHTL